MMHEYVINLHMHTPYSDGHGLHAEIARAALDANLDAVIVTDHNVLVRGPEGYYRDGDRRVLMLIGQEVHDQARQPQKNHMLVIGAERDVAPLAFDPQRLIDGVQQAEGLSFLAHPSDPAAPAIKEDDLGWVSWEVEHFTGLEIWNSLSELKARIKTRLHGLYYLAFPDQVAEAPFPDVLRRWDELTAAGQRVVGIGGSDAHAIPIQFGPVRRTVFPYAFHFQGINTHVFTQEPLSGEADEDANKILTALRRGNAFIGYDRPASTRGFRFTARGREETVWMGDKTSIKDGLTFQIRLPLPTNCRLLHNGREIKSWDKRETCTYITTEPGVYRVEANIQFLGKRRGWIFSNPIYVEQD